MIENRGRLYIPRRIILNYWYKMSDEKLSYKHSERSSLSPELPMRLRLENCGSRIWRKKCGDCGHDWFGSSSLCGVSYCNHSHCIEFRVNRYYHKLQRYNIQSRKMFHMVIGFPLYDSYPDKAELKKQKKLLSRFDQKVRRMGYSFRRLRAFDVQITNNTDGSRKFYVHYHYAVLPEMKLGTCADDFNKAIQYVSEGRIKVVKQLGTRRTNGLLKYIAVRLGGVFGHDDEKRSNKVSTQYGYSHFLSLDEYYEKAYNVRNFSASGFKYRLSENDVQIRVYKRKFGRLPHEVIGSTIRLTSQLYCSQCGSFNVKTLTINRHSLKGVLKRHWETSTFEELLSFLIENSDVALESDYVYHKPVFDSFFQPLNEKQRVLATVSHFDNTKQKIALRFEYEK